MKDPEDKNERAQEQNSGEMNPKPKSSENSNWDKHQQIDEEGNEVEPEDINNNYPLKKILMVLTSHSEMENTDSKTGVWLGEFTDPYYEFIDAGYALTLTSPQGGRPPVDPMSELTENITVSNRRFQDDESAKAAFSHTIPLNQINPADYDAVFYPGGHGPIWDLANDNNSGILIHEFLDAGKPVAAVCHGPAALISAEIRRPGFLRGKIISAFSNAEEAMVGRSSNVPYLLQTKLEELGAEVKTALVPFLSHVERDGLLITGQNPLSAGPAASALIELLAEKGTA